MASASENHPTLLSIAERFVKSAAARRPLPSGYGMQPGERALLVVNSFYDPAVVEAIVQAMRRVPAEVDVVTIDMGPDRPLTYEDELWAYTHNCPGVPENNEVRKWIYSCPWADKAAVEGKYDIMIYTMGGPGPEGPFRYETLPWASRETFPAAAFPYEVWDLLDRKTWDLIWNKGKGGKCRITDPEGTDVTFTLFEKYWDVSRYERVAIYPMFTPEPFLGHLWGRQTPPYSEQEDATGVIAGTTNGVGRPYPHMKVHLEGSRVTAFEGGGGFGDALRQLLEIGKNIRYPEYPNEGLFWWWEAAIGTHPKMRRPSNAYMLSGAAGLHERLRSGVIHCGLGTPITGPSEGWARERNLPYGHVHVHLLNATYEITCRDGSKIKVIDNGHLTTLDAPEVIAVAANYGDPQEVLREEWRAPIPGITVPGDYWRDYAPDPAGWIEAHKEA